MAKYRVLVICMDFKAIYHSDTHMLLFSVDTENAEGSHYIGLVYKCTGPANKMCLARTTLLHWQMLLF